MPTIDNYKRSIAQTPGGMVAQQAAWLVEFIEDVIGTGKTVHSSHLSLGSTTIWEVIYQWTDASSNTVNLHCQVYAAWAAEGVTTSAYPLDMMMSEPAMSPQMVVDFNSAGMTGYAPNDARDWMVSALDTELELPFGVCANHSGDCLIYSDLVGYTDAITNRAVFMWIRHGWYHGSPILYYNRLTILNFDPAGTQFGSYVDFAQSKSGQTIPTLPGMTQLVDGVEALALKQTTVSLNNGAAVYSVESAVTG